MSDKDEYEYISKNYSKEHLEDWIEIYEPWRLKGTVKEITDKMDKLELTEKELYALNKDEQIELLNSIGITDIPRLEKDRVNKIMRGD